MSDDNTIISLILLLLIIFLFIFVKERVILSRDIYAAFALLGLSKILPQFIFKSTIDHSSARKTCGLVCA